MGEELHRVRLIRQAVEALNPEAIPEALRGILVIPEGRSYVDVEMPTATAEAVRNVVIKRFWELDKKTQAMQIRAVHAQWSHIVGKVGRGSLHGPEDR